MSSDPRGPTRPLSCAPMVARTDRHFRALVRRLCRGVLLYTEMVPLAAASRGRELTSEVPTHMRPLALQLAGTDASALAMLARRAEGLGYDEVNLNCGCPSPAARDGGYGVRLMGEPARVAACVDRMRAATRIPITVKHRLGFDDLDRFEDLLRFVDIVASAGADRFIVHARKAWLSGVSPRDNRTRPPLRWNEVIELKAARPRLRIELNGGVSSLEQVERLEGKVDGVMIGRALYEDPWLVADADARIFGVANASPLEPRALAQWLLEYAAWWVERGGRLAEVTRHALTLFKGWPGARGYRGHLSTFAPRDGATVEVLEAALAWIDWHAQDDARRSKATKQRVPLVPCPTR